MVNANKAVDKAQKALDGTGAAAIIAERDDAQADLTKAQADETKAQSDLATAQAADAKKASDIASLTQTQTQQQATADQTATALATAQADAKTKADAKTAADTAVSKLSSQIAAIDNLTTPKLSQDVIDAYKKFVKDKSQSNKDALFDAIDTWYTKDLANYTKTMVTPIDATVVNPANLTEDQVTALSQYYVMIGNAIRKQIWGSSNEDVIVTKDAVQAAMQIAKNYTAENDNTGDHSYTALENDGNNNVDYSSEGIAFISTKTTTMTQLYRNILSISINTWSGDYNQNYAHITNEYWTRSISSSSSSSTTKLSGAFVTSVTPGGFGRAHTIQFLDNGGNTIASPYDTTALKAQLATAKTTQTQATAANTQAQSTLASATTANTAAQNALKATTNQLNTLKATADQTPAAQATLTSATTVRKAAEVRLAAAQQAVDNLNADVATKTKALEDAKSVQAKAVAADTSVKATLAQARTTNDKAQAALAETRATIASLEAVADQTPAAQATLISATAVRQAAETRLTKAQQAVDNLNADVATKTKALEDAKGQLATEEAKLAQLKEAKSTSEVVLAEAQSKVEALKAEEAKIADEIAVLKAQLAEQVAKLAALKNADQVLADAQAELAKAIEAHTAAKATLDAEIDKLDQFLKNQRDAKAQYEAVKEAYTQAQIVAQRQAINDAGGQPIAITDKVGKIVGYFDGNQTAGTKLQPITYSRVEKYRQLPQTGSQESLLVLLGYTALAGLGLGYAKKRRRG